MSEVALQFRTALFAMGDRPERYAKAAASGTDAVILDLEDGVAGPAKPAARAALRTNFTDLPVILRINGHGTPWHAADIEVAAALSFAAIMVPKADATGALDVIASGPAGSRPIIALIETARGLAQARQIAALPFVARLAFGSIDFCAELGCDHTREALLAARSELVLASKLAGKPAPVDGVTTSLDDPALVEADAGHARSLGFGAKLCIHPKQIDPVRRAFRSAPEEIAWARRVLESGDGAANVGGKMVDEPVRIMARRILGQADL